MRYQSGYQSSRATELNSTLQLKGWGASFKEAHPLPQVVVTRSPDWAHPLPQVVLTSVAFALSLVMLMIALAGITMAQEAGAATQGAPVSSLIATGQQQLQAARTANTEDAYRTAEATFDRAVKLEPKDPTARLYLGLARMELSGWLARKGSFGPSGELMTQASADLDAAVALGPDNIQVRMSRGASYAEFPSFLNKGALAREDLEAVVHHPNSPRRLVTCGRGLTTRWVAFTRRAENLKRRELHGLRPSQRIHKVVTARRRNSSWGNLPLRWWLPMTRAEGCRIVFRR